MEHLEEKRNQAWREYSRASWVQGLAFDTSVAFLVQPRGQRRGMLGLASRSIRKTNLKLEEYRISAAKAHKAIMKG